MPLGVTLSFMARGLGAAVPKIQRCQKEEKDENDDEGGETDKKVMNVHAAWKKKCTCRGRAKGVLKCHKTLLLGGPLRKTGWEKNITVDLNIEKRLSRGKTKKVLKGNIVQKEKLNVLGLMRVETRRSSKSQVLN